MDGIATLTLLIVCFSPSPSLPYGIPGLRAFPSETSGGRVVVGEGMG